MVIAVLKHHFLRRRDGTPKAHAHAAYIPTFTEYGRRSHVVEADRPIAHGITQQRHQQPDAHRDFQPRLAKVLNNRFSTSTPFSRAYLKATVSEIRITDDLLKLKGENKVLANLIANNGKIAPKGAVLGFIPSWRAR